MGNFIKKIGDSIARKNRKRKSIQAVLSQPQSNQSVVNLHRLDPTNVGDYYCAPHHYFPELKDTELDIFDYKVKEDATRDKWIEEVSQNALVIGGGGLLNRNGFGQQMKLFEKLGQKGKKTVLWGVGHNEPSASYYGKDISYSIDTDKFGLVGVRDFGREETWVPCVSCMHPIFDNNESSQHEIGILFHKKTLKNPKITQSFSDFPSSSNTTSLEDMVNFIKSTEVLLTDSYHAMYWGMLLEKKVMVFPNSTKFFDFKYSPVLSSFDNWKDDLPKLTKHTGVLEECRSINKAFSQKVFNYLDV